MNKTYTYKKTEIYPTLQKLSGFQSKKNKTFVSFEVGGVGCYLETPVFRCFFSNKPHEFLKTDVFLGFDVIKLCTFLSYCEGDCVFTLHENEFSVTNSKKRATFPYKIELSIETISKANDIDAGSFTTEEAMKTVRNLSLCTSKDNTKPVLKSILNTQTKEGKTKLVVTDGFRLLVIHDKSKQGPEKDYKITIDFYQEVLKILDSKDKPKLSISDTKLYIQTPLMIGEAGFTQGDFPNYQKVIPATIEGVMTVKKDDLERSIKLITSLSDEKTGTVVVEIAEQDMKIRLKNPQGEKNNTTLSYTLKSANHVSKIALNSRYVLDFLSMCENEDLTILSTKADAPLLLVPGSHNNLPEALEQDINYIIMPIRIGENE